MLKIQRKNLAFFAAISLAGFLSGAVGCEPSATTVQSAPPTAIVEGGNSSSGPHQASRSAASENTALPKTAPTENAQKETWDVCRIKGTRVGFLHTREIPLVEAGVDLIDIRVDQQLTLKRFQQTIVQKLSLSSVETTDGKLVRFSATVSSGKEETVSQGEVDGDQLRIKTTSVGKTIETKIPWNPVTGGFFAADLSLRHQPLKPSETRTIKLLMPVFNVVGETRLEAVAVEPTAVGEQENKLLKVRRVDLIGPNKIETVLWTNEQGESLKTLLPDVGLETIRTTRSIALQDEAGPAFDLGQASVVKVSRRLPNAHDTSLVRYRATLKSGDVTNIFASQGGQSVRQIDEQTAEITVRAVRPNRPTELVADSNSAPTDADRSSNSFIQSDDERVQKMAESVAPDENDSWKLACALERHVRGAMRVRDFSQALATAAEVAKSLEGDCTEHAVLLAALCRARGLPARVAIGLVYYPPVPGFAYHMWNEVWINDRWIPLDATLGRSGIGGGHIKLLTSNLQASDAYSAFLPVFQVLGKLNLEILAAE